MKRQTTSQFKKLAVLQEVDKILAAHHKIHELVDPDKKYMDLEPDGGGSWGFYDYYSILDLVYREYIGVSRNMVESMFTAPGDPERNGRPVAWLSEQEKTRLKEKFPEVLTDYVSCYRSWITCS